MEPFRDRITSEDELREWYRQPPELTQRKRVDRLDDHCRAFIEHSPFVPGRDETLRVNGRGCITRDPDVLAACAVKDRAPTAAIGVEVVEAFVHCAKAFRRGDVWDPKAWPDQSRLASAACMLRDHVELGDLPEETVTQFLEDGYAQTMWEPGG